MAVRYTQAMQSPKTWIVKVEMSQPAVIKGVPTSGPAAFTDKDATQLSQRLSGLPFDAPRLLVNATVNDQGVLIAFFETTSEPSQDECVALYRLTAGALGVLRRPTKFNCVNIYPGSTTEIGYML